jgi:hypothetical protein
MIMIDGKIQTLPKWPIPSVSPSSYRMADQVIRQRAGRGLSPLYPVPVAVYGKQK